MPIRFLAAVLLISCLPASLNAADFYLGAGIGPQVEAGAFGRDLERFTEADGGTWKLFGGLELGRHWALEATTLEFSDKSCCGGNVVDLDFTSTVGGYSLATLARWPVGRLVPFVKAGVLFWEEEALIAFGGAPPVLLDGTDPVLGLGVELELPTRFGARAEWVRYELDGATSDSVTASMLIRFRE